LMLPLISVLTYMRNAIQRETPKSSSVLCLCTQNGLLTFILGTEYDHHK